MPRGASDIPDLRLVRLQKLITSFTTPPNLLLSNLFGSDNAESDTIEWESIIGNRGLTPFAAPGGKAHTVEPSGVAKHTAKAAFWKEKMYLDEVFLNNLRQPGTIATYQTAKSRLARELGMMRNRCDRRLEWMWSQMFTAGSITYSDMKGLQVYVNYSLPSANSVSLAANRHWDTGTSRNILEDIMDAKIYLSKSCGARINYAMFTSEILKLMVLDTSIQTLLQKSAYGQGDLFARPLTVLGSLLDIDSMVLYDEQFQLTAWITAAVTGGSSTTIYVDNASDFEAAATLKFHDVSAGTDESETISSVDVNAGTITVSTAPTASFRAGEDKVTMTKRFLSESKFTMFASTVDGVPIAEHMKAPFGLDRHYGIKVDDKDEWDPEGKWVRVQNKGLPVLYNRDAIYILTVKD